MGARWLFRRRLEFQSDVPLISFTFDDFPQSALHAGGSILKGFGARGTYYASLGLMGTEAPTGRIFNAQDLALLLDEGHELGNHTFSHCDSWLTSPAKFEASVVENQKALAALRPNALFQTLSYPIHPPRAATKRRMAPLFRCCRGGGQTFNSGTIDLNYLASFFLEQSRDNFGAVKSVIEQNRRACGWLIFSTHDISPNPTLFGCTPAFFEEVVRCAVESGAHILPVVGALEHLRQSSRDQSDP